MPMFLVLFAVALMLPLRALWTVRARAVLVFGLLAATVSADAQLVKYRDWLDSPEAYFLTRDERARWRGVRDDEQATVFINDFFERRGGLAFRTTIDHRAGIADRYFSTPTRRGSATLRGKLIVLFGAPSHIGASKLRTQRYISYAPPAPAVSNLGRGSAPAAGASSARAYRYFRLVFPAQNLAAFGGADYNINIEVDQSTGEERLTSGKDKKRLAALTAAAIDAAITKR